MPRPRLAGLARTALLALALLAAACGTSAPKVGAPGPTVATVPPLGADKLASSMPTTEATSAPAPPTTTARPAGPAAAPVTAGGTPEPPAGFTFVASPLAPDARARMTGPVWRPGCPVSLDDLRTIRLSFWGFDGAQHEGTLVVNADAVATLRGVFAELHAARWPIRQMQAIEDYGGDDNASMDADNTSAFNCRPAAGTTSTWSQHAYGRAIDINPRENPYVTSGGVEPKAGQAFLDRGASRPGLINAGSVIVASFDRRGWGWGGRWSTTKDYQHFSSTGR